MKVNSTDSSTYTDASYSNKGASGLISGLDTESMVKSMLSGIQTKIDRKTQEQEQLEWKQETYRDVISKINTFQDKYLNLTSDSCVRSSTLFTSKQTTCSTSAVSVSANSSAVSGSRKIDVAQLATSTVMTGGTVSSGAVRLSSTFGAPAAMNTVTMTIGEDSVDVDLTGCADNNAIATTLNTALSDAGMSGSFALTDGKLKYTGTEALALDGAAGGLKKMGLGGKLTAAVAEGETDYTLTTGALDATATVDSAELSLTLDGVTKKITLTAGADFSAFQSDVQKAFGDGITFTDNGDGSMSLSTGAGRSLSVGGKQDALDMVGLAEATSTTVSTTTAINSLQLSSGTALSAENYKFSINGTEITVDGTATVAELMNKVNSSDAGVTMSYNSMTDRFSLTSSTTGSGFQISLDDPNGLLGALNLTGSDTSVTQGQNAIVAVDSVVTERSSNSFTFDGLTVTLNDVTGSYTDGVDANGNRVLTANGATDTAVVGTSSNTDKIFDSIKSFVDDYNTMISDLNDMIHAKATYKDYAPLTDEMEDEMSDKEIEKWNEKARGGLMHNDSDISSYLQNMRTALYSKYGESTLAKFGIETSTNYKDYGKLSINEDKLRTALETDTESVREIFVGTDGIGAALNKICTDTAGTSSGSPGTLVQLAGVEGKATESENTISRQISNIEDRISVLKELYEARKTRYWEQFNSMETALSSLSSTSSYLTNMMSG